MIDRINDDIKSAMKSKNKPRLDALRLLKSALLENKTSKKPADEADVAIAHVKKIKDSITCFPSGSDEVTKLNNEILELADYVPQPMSKHEVEELVASFVKSNEGVNFGTVMKFISPKIKGKFDGREASQLVKTMLESV